MKLFPLHLIPNDTKFDFMRTRWVAVTIAAIMFVASIGLIFGKGFNYALDFTGGTVVEVRFEKPADVDAVRDHLEGAGYAGAQVQNFGSGSDLLIRLQPQELGEGEDAGEANTRTAQAVLQAISLADNKATVMSSEFVGPQVGRELAMNGVYAALFVIVGFLIYIGFRFELKFAIVATLTTLFDVLVTAAFFAATGPRVRPDGARRPAVGDGLLDQ
jgi:Preprotein translocase subunit SecF